MWFVCVCVKATQVFYVLAFLVLHETSSYLHKTSHNPFGITRYTILRCIHIHTRDDALRRCSLSHIEFMISFFLCLSSFIISCVYVYVCAFEHTHTSKKIICFCLRRTTPDQQKIFERFIKFSYFFLYLLRFL